MKFCVVMGSPRVNGNTAELCKPFIARLEEKGAEVEYFKLATMDIEPCIGCYACQDVSGGYGCVQDDDDMSTVVDAFRAADCIVLATPIYSWYCPSKMKAVLDRHYGMNKYYGSASGSLWAGKHVAILATHGYDADYALEPFVTGVERLCKHSELIYDGVYSVQDEDDLASFQTPEAMDGARAFADKLVGILSE